MSGMGNLANAIGVYRVVPIIGGFFTIIIGAFYCLNNNYSIFSCLSFITFLMTSVASIILVLHISTLAWNKFDIYGLFEHITIALVSYLVIFCITQFIFMLSNQSYLLMFCIGVLLVLIIITAGYIVQMPDVRNWLKRKKSKKH